MLRKLSGRALLILGSATLVALVAVGVAAYLAAVWAVSFLTWPGVATLLLAEAVVGAGAVLDYREARLEPPTRFTAWLLAHYTVVRRGYRRVHWHLDGVKTRRRALAAQQAALAQRAAGQSSTAAGETERGAA
jgi:hypothetical protein